jgi:hypothetical protein
VTKVVEPSIADYRSLCIAGRIGTDSFGFGGFGRYARMRWRGDCHVARISNSDSMSRITIVQGYSDRQGGHFCHALAESYATGAKHGRHEVRRVEVVRLDFPLLKSQAEYQSGATPEALRRAQADPVWADQDDVDRDGRRYKRRQAGHLDTEACRVGGKSGSDSDPSRARLSVSRDNESRLVRCDTDSRNGSMVERQVV